MLRRVLLALTFVAALGVAGLGISNTAEAGHGCYRGGGGYYGAYYGPAPYYGPRQAYYYGPPAYYGPSAGYYDYGRGYRGHRRSGFSVSIGF